MGTRTLTEMWDDIRLATQRPTLDTGRITRWIMAGMKEFGYAFQFQELQEEGSLTTVAGTLSYSLPANLRSLSDEGAWITLPVTSIRKLKKETRTQYQLRIGDTTNTQARGAPNWYHTYKRLMYLRGIPDTVYTIKFDYWKTLTEISLPGDVSPFTDDWDDIVLMGGLYRAFRSQGEHGRYINIRNDFLGLIRSRALDEDLEEMPQGGLNIITDPSRMESDTDA